MTQPETVVEDGSMPVGDATDRDLLASVRSGVCPACGRPKQAVSIACTACSDRLAGATLAGLVRAFGTTRYRAKFAAAMGELGATCVRGVPAAEGGGRDAT